MAGEGGHTDTRLTGMAKRFEKPVLVATVLVIPASIAEESRPPASSGDDMH